MSTKDIPENREPAQLLGLGSRDKLGLLSDLGYMQPHPLIALVNDAGINISSEDALKFARLVAAALAHETLPRHNFWRAGEPDCPKELRAADGELQTLRCKVCGEGWRKSVDVCFDALGGGF